MENRSEAYLAIDHLQMLRYLIICFEVRCKYISSHFSLSRIFNKKLQSICQNRKCVSLDLENRATYRRNSIIFCSLLIHTSEVDYRVSPKHLNSLPHFVLLAHIQIRVRCKLIKVIKGIIVLFKLKIAWNINCFFRPSGICIHFTSGIIGEMCSELLCMLFSSKW